MFHSARWDHDYDLTGKRVAVDRHRRQRHPVLPGIAPVVEQLNVFQRTAAWVIPRDTAPYSEGAKRRFARYPWWRRLHRARLYWTNESRVWPMFHSGLSQALRGVRADFIRRRSDPELRKP